MIDFDEYDDFIVRVLNDFQQELISKSQENHIDIGNTREVVKCDCPKEDKVAEREFYYNQKNKLSGTRIFCKCGHDWFIPD